MRISARVSQNFLKKTKINPGKDIMSHVRTLQAEVDGGLVRLQEQNSRECITITKTF